MQQGSGEKEEAEEGFDVLRFLAFPERTRTAVTPTETFPHASPPCIAWFCMVLRRRTPFVLVSSSFSWKR